MKQVSIYVISLMIVFIFSSGCTDKDMGENPDSELAPISSLADFQALLDNMPLMQETPGLNEVSANDYYLPADTTGLSLDPNERNAYLWKVDIFEGRGEVGDWNVLYKQIFQANTVLDRLPHIDPADTSVERNYIKGRAFFYRAYALYHVVLQFASLFDSTSTTLGVPIRLTSDPEPKSTRALVRIVYRQIIEDLEQARHLVPGKVEITKKNRPSLPAVYATLARIYLSMREYRKAGLYADSALQLYPTLINFNNIYQSSSDPFSGRNDEVIYDSHLLSTTSILLKNKCFVDSNLYRSYESNDLRKTVFFSLNTAGLPVLRFNYTGTEFKFSGLATDELYLIRAEAYAFAGNIMEAMTDLNKLRENRYISPVSPLVAANAQQALQWIRMERRKELIYRGIRWGDIRRYDKEGARISLTRSLSGERATLQSEDPRYILPIPPDIIQITGMPQNQRK
ncbi:RagB/SusD family nutrient uptake outer membrane protein [Longitalea luteola]|uniref:RagB/SusD family nutrient uptake outer membrane protein n=1 Tax=Longitalea luteola TaxID=2812563 RepID=UPI001A97CEEE|nr:RagB/SusD family nutrient uptake outer membrane protein [Longitalea luteola]